MNFKSLIFIITLAASVTGCSTPKYNYQPAASIFSVPPIGETNTAGLGESLLDQGVSTNRDIIIIEKPFSIMAYDVAAGKMIKIGEDKNYAYYGQSYDTGYLITGGLLIKTIMVNATIQVNKSTQELCIIRPLDADVCDSTNFRLEQELVTSKKSFRQTLIYTGKVGTKLRMAYREYSGDLARPAFNTDVEYDLNQSKEVGYAGAILEIIDASNTKITYKVINNFNTP